MRITGTSIKGGYMKADLLKDIIKCNALIESTSGDTKIALSKLLRLLEIWYDNLV